jgi:DNA-binding transcriptional ArsR family regulator
VLNLTIVADQGNYLRVSGPRVEVARVLRVLADPVRLQTVELLSRAPRRAGQLAEDLGVTPATMSKHLRLLLREGMVVDERGPDDARVRVFRLRPEAVVALDAWLDQLKAHWDEQLGSFKTHVEKRSKP